MAILMCRPDYFGVEYEINPWMHVQVAVDNATATTQWQALHRTYRDLGVDIELAEPVRGLPDMVFTANAAVVWNRRAVLSRFHHPERQGEEPHWREVLERLGFEVHDMPPHISFEGAGDALFVGERMFCGYGFRTDVRSHAHAARVLGVEHVSLELIDPRFYHLDTCFCPLDDSTVLFAASAFAPAARETVHRLVPNVIEVTPDIAAGFACNAMPQGRTVVSSLSLAEIDQPLRAHGFTPVTLPMGEFMKSGGGVRCLSLPLDVGVPG